jgi:hypothetical protein
MKLDDFRKIVLEPDSNRAREMATPIRRATLAAKTSSEKTSSVESENPISSSALKRRISKEHSPDKLLSKSSTASDINKLVNKNRISPPKQKLKSELEKPSVENEPEKLNLSTVLEKPIAENENEKNPEKLNFLTFYLQQPVIWCSNFVSVCGYLIDLPSRLLHWCKTQLDVRILSSPVFPYFVILTGLYLASFISMTYPLFALCRLVLGTLYPAYASYKAVRTKNVREYVS